MALTLYNLNCIMWHDHTFLLLLFTRCLVTCACARTNCFLSPKKGVSTILKLANVQKHRFFKGKWKEAYTYSFNQDVLVKHTSSLPNTELINTSYPVNKTFPLLLFFQVKLSLISWAVPVGLMSLTAVGINCFRRQEPQILLRCIILSKPTALAKL